ncbi:MAG TPA: ABC transporter substrate binding protein [Candidatus Eisenbacteria bacterium]|nr:ABC transporter substrate binding protein [Candidatus Eisenbacteria bacterium]
MRRTRRTAPLTLNVRGEARSFALSCLELVQQQVDVIVTVGTPGVLAAKNATRTIPIVFVSVSDPVARGVVASLARPGGIVTG